jgi:predicted NBD/HSP70 family sugar kinase
MYLGLDIGGTKTLVATLDDNGVIVDRARFPTPDDYQVFLEQLKTTIEDFSTANFKACGVGMQGIINRSNGDSTWTGGNLKWAQCPITDDIAAAVGCPVVVENDANLAALSEAQLVKDQYQTVLYITLSTGIGSGFVVDGSLDPKMLDAEVGHMIYPAADGYKTWEQMASGGTIVEEYGQRAEEISDPATWQAISERLAIGLINLSAALTPQVIILGGGVGAHLDRFKNYLDEQIQKLAPSGVHVPPIRQAQRAEEAVLYGCYDLAKQRFGDGSTA